MAARFYYLGPWVDALAAGKGLGWAPPEGTVGLIDMRPLSPTITHGFFATDRALGSDYTAFGDAAGTDLRALTMSVAQRTLWASMLGITKTPRAGTLADLLWDTLTIYSDPDGAVRAKPIMPTSAGVLQLHLGGHSLLRGRRMPRDPTRAAHWPKMQRVLQEDYRRIRRYALESSDQKGRETHRRVLGSQALKYGVDHEAAGRLFVPDDLPPGRPLKPETTITESFDKANSDTLGPDLTWAEVDGDTDVVSNEASFESAGGSAVAAARAEHDLSSDDHYAQIDLTNSASSNGGGAAVRFDPSALIFYMCWAVDGGTYLLYKYSAGFTQLDTTGITISTPEAYKMEIDGSSLKGYQAGVERVSATDSSLTGDVRTGIIGQPPINVDDFIAADLTATVPALDEGMLVGGLMALSGGLA